MKAIAKSSVDCDDTSRESDTLICGFGPRRRGGDANSISSDNNIMENGLNSSLICGFGGGDGNSHGSGSTGGRGGEQVTTSIMVPARDTPSSAYSTSIPIPTKTEDSASRGITRLDSNKSLSSEGDSMSMASEDAVVLMLNMLEEEGDNNIGGEHGKDNEKFITDEVCGRVFKRQSITDYESIPTELEIDSGALDQSWSASLHNNNNHNSDKKILQTDNENKVVEELNSHSKDLVTKSIPPQATTPESQQTAFDTRPGGPSQHPKQCLKQTGMATTKNVSINNHATYIAENGERNGESNVGKGRNIRTNKPTVSFQSLGSNNHVSFPSAVGSSEVDQNLDVIEEDESDSSTVASDLKYSMLSEATDVVSDASSSGSDPDFFSSTNLTPIGEHAKSMARQLKMNPSHAASSKRIRE